MMPVGEAGTTAGATAPLSLQVLGVGRGFGNVENSCQEGFSVSLSNSCHREGNLYGQSVLGYLCQWRRMASLPDCSSAPLSHHSGWGLASGGAQPEFGANTWTAPAQGEGTGRRAGRAPPPT